MKDLRQKWSDTLYECKPFVDGLQIYFTSLEEKKHKVRKQFSTENLNYNDYEFSAEDSFFKSNILPNYE